MNETIDVTYEPGHVTAGESGAEKCRGLTAFDSRRRTPTVLALVIVAVVIESSLLLVHCGPTEATQVALELVAYVISGIAFAWMVVRQKTVDSRQAGTGELAVVLVAAVAFRLTLLPLAPASSSDVYRYLWEGLVQAAGLNPLTTPPDDASLSHLAHANADIYRMVNHRSIPTIYPPFAQFLFWLNAVAFGGSLLGWKLILLFFDLMLAFAGWALLRIRGLPIWTLSSVLWCPLLLLETYGGGHLDIVGVALVVVALLAHERRHATVAGAALGLAFNVKYTWPALALILLVARPGPPSNRIRMAVSAIIVVALCWIPYMGGITALFSTTRMFAETWRFNGAVFDLLRLMPGPCWLPMAIVLITLGLAAAWLGRRPVGNSWPDVWLLFGAAMFFLPVAFPWYFIWIVPALLMDPARWILVWLSLVPLLHLVDWRHRATGDWHPMPWLWITLGVVPAILLTRAFFQRLETGRRTGQVTGRPQKRSVR